MRRVCQAPEPVERSRYSIPALRKRSIRRAIKAINIGELNRGNCQNRHGARGACPERSCQMVATSPSRRRICPSAASCCCLQTEASGGLTSDFARFLLQVWIEPLKLHIREGRRQSSSSAEPTQALNTIFQRRRNTAIRPNP